MSTPSTENGWDQATLQEILPLKYGKTRSGQFGYERADTATFGSNGAFGTFERALTNCAAIIIGRKGAAGTVHYSAEPCWPIDTAFYTEGSEEVFLPFFRYLLENLQLVRLDRSTAIPSLSRDDYNSKVIFYPESLDEQRRIVAEIEKQFTRLDAGVAALQRVRSKLRRYRASVLKSACEGRLVPTEAELARQKVEAASRRLDDTTEKSRDGSSTYETAETLLQRILTERRAKWNGRGKYSEPAPPSTPDLPQLPEGWVWASIQQITADSLIGLDRGRAQQTIDSMLGLPYIKMNNISMDGMVMFEKLVYVAANPEEARRFAVQNGDILFNTRNSKELVGKVGLVRSSPPNAIYNNNLMRIRLLSDVIPAFLNYQMCSTEFRRRMELVKKATTNVAAIYAKDLFPLAVAIPPLAEQERIVAEVERRLSVVDELEATVTANLKRAARLRQAILQQAFTGKLTQGLPEY